MIAKGFSKPTERVERLRNQIIDAVPHIESDRAKLLTESYRRTENEPRHHAIDQRAKNNFFCVFILPE